MKKLFAFIFIVAIVAGIARLGFSYTAKGQFAASSITEVDTVVTLYFPNSVRDPKHAHCDEVESVTRHIMASDMNLHLRTVQALFAGPIADERKQGFYTAIPKKAPLSFFSESSQGTEVVVDYDDRALGKCMSETLNTQITKTLRQFEIPSPLVINPDYLIEKVYVGGEEN